MKKKDDIRRMFQECWLDILGLTEKKLMREGEMGFRGLEGLNLG